MKEMDVKLSSLGTIRRIVKSIPRDYCNTHPASGILRNNIEYAVHQQLQAVKLPCKQDQKYDCRQKKYLCNARIFHAGLQSRVINCNCLSDIDRKYQVLVQLRLKQVLSQAFTLWLHSLRCKQALEFAMQSAVTFSSHSLLRRAFRHWVATVICKLSQVQSQADAKPSQGLTLSTNVPTPSEQLSNFLKFANDTCAWDNDCSMNHSNSMHNNVNELVLCNYDAQSMIQSRLNENISYDSDSKAAGNQDWLTRNSSQD
jgi:AraC-like DNA-binding protein